MNIILGSAQFGLNYGFPIQKGQVNEAEVEKILRLAYESGIAFIDTAVTYGNSEKILGKYCSRIGEFQFISKINLHKGCNFKRNRVYF